MTKTLYVDMDSTICEHWPRIMRNTIGGVIQPSAFTWTEIEQDGPIEGALQALFAFYQAGWKIKILTARDWENGYNDTIKWLNVKGALAVIDEVICVKSSREKTRVLLDRGDCTLFVDDFMSGQEGWPVFNVNDYQSATTCRIPTVVFRNNWDEILVRWCK